MECTCPVLGRVTAWSPRHKFDLKTNITRNNITILPIKVREKLSIIEYLKQQKTQNYIVPDRKILMKVVIRGLPILNNLELNKGTLNCRAFSIIKISQVETRRDGELHPHFFAELPKKRVFIRNLQRKVII